MPRHASFLALCLALLPLACLAEGAPEKAPLEALEGRWKVVSMTVSPKLTAPDRGVLGTLYFIFAKGKLYTASSNPLVISGGSQNFSLTPEVVPQQIQWMTSKDAKDSSCGIYRVEKDKLTICTSTSAEKRPKEFKIDPAEPQTLLELVRDEIAVDPDFVKLAGTWKVTRRQGATVDGVPNNRQLEFPKTMEFQDLPYQNKGNVIWKDAKGESLGTFDWKMDSSKSPKQISLTGFFRRGKEQHRFFLDGVYELADDALSLTMGAQGDRPESAKPKQPLKTARIGLTRIAKEEK